jgi:hypothetical protein
VEVFTEISHPLSVQICLLIPETTIFGIFPKYQTLLKSNEVESM